MRTVLERTTRKRMHFLRMHWYIDLKARDLLRRETRSRFCKFSTNIIQASIRETIENVLFLSALLNLLQRRDVRTVFVSLCNHDSSYKGTDELSENYNSLNSSENWLWSLNSVTAVTEFSDYSHW